MTGGHRIDALSADGRVESMVLTPSAGPPWRLAVRGLGMSGEAFEGEDLFGALVALRKHLERLGWRLLCAGARRDVYPSGMARGMGSARTAYVTEIGKPALDLVDIFGEALPEQVGTVDEQQLFRQEWIASLREKMK